MPQTRRIPTLPTGSNYPIKSRTHPVEAPESPDLPVPWLPYIGSVGRAASHETSGGRCSARLSRLPLTRESARSRTPSCLWRAEPDTGSLEAEDLPAERVACLHHKC